MSAQRHLSVVAPQLTSAQARKLTDQAKTKASDLWQRLLDLYEGGAHRALDYSSWGDYMRDEFATSTQRAYQLLDAGRVARAIESHSTNVEPPHAETAARELAKVQRAEGDEAAVATWDDAVAQHGSQPTAAQVRKTAAKRKSKGKTKRAPAAPATSLTKSQQRVARALRSMSDSADYLAFALAEREGFDVDETTRAAWHAQVVQIRAVLTHLARRTQ